MSSPGLFLDRDGVINVDTDFACRPQDIVFQQGIFDVVAVAIQHGYVPVVVTNQSGIARGYFSESAFHDLTAWMMERFEAAGSPLAGVYHCPYHPDAVVAEFRHPDHPWRKPRPGMLFAARDEFGLDLTRSAMIGDRWTDAAAASAAGVPHIAIVGSLTLGDDLPEGLPEVRRIAEVADCGAWLLELSALRPAGEPLASASAPRDRRIRLLSP